MNEYEIELEWIGKGKKPTYLEEEYGFGENPPIVINAKNKANAIKQLKLNKNIKIKKIKQV